MVVRVVEGADRPSAGTLRLVVVASIAGAATGVVASTFGLLLEHAASLRGDLIGWAHDRSVLGFAVLLLVVAATTTAAALMVHRMEPHAEGSGIPRVEAIVEGRADPGRARILPVKYVGGLLAIGGGLALGREGPSVQMGGVVASVCARVTRLGRDDLRMVVAGGAAAGLATAFNAPIAGGVFVLEELFKRFDPRASLATLAASGSGFAATHLLHADDLVFTMPTLPAPSLSQAPLVVMVALLCGVLGVAYNRAVMAGLRFVDTTRVPVVVRSLAIGAAVGLLAWLAPGWVGSGDNLTQDALLGHGAVATVVLMLAVRFALGVVSYAANTPGGLFAPMLVLGTESGLLVGLVAAKVTTLAPGMAAALALTGLAAFFTASVQAPVTGLILATEMTGSVTWLPPMLGAVALAMLLARLLGGIPIYDALTARSAHNARVNLEDKGLVA
ncbi:chloride channel protein [Nocardioides sp. DS6]|uniref:Chloride channel protein n=1 Tax=Nocardioides eburneus TaxID=3231482 RepID=A0ABV3SZR6_9ACTN